MKIKTMIACVLAVTCVTPSAFAQISANTGAREDSIVISGSISQDETQIVLMKPGFAASDAENAVASSDKSELGKVIEYYGQASALNNNVDTKIPMREDSVKGKYTLIVDKDTYSVYFATLKERLEVMVPAAKTALANGTFAEFAETDGKYFCNSSLYESLNNGKNAAKYAEALLSEYVSLDASGFMPRLSDALNMGIIMEALNEKKINDIQIIKTMTDTSDVVVPLDKIDLIDADKVNNIISDISGKSYASPEAYEKQLSESIFLNVLNNASKMNNPDKKEFFEEYAEELGVKLTEYNKLSDNKKLESVARIAAEKCKTIQALQEFLDKFCKSNTTSNTPTPGGGGGGGSSSGSDFGIRAIPNIQNNNDTNSGKLTDLGECVWAKPAIEFLVNNKMISGYEDNTFKPYKNVSRAEFISIVARKYLPGDAAYGQSFSDVSSDKWCFGSIESAYHSGIISGTGESVFAPDANISRQDMAVILCRLASYVGKEISGEAEAFNDDASISAYAKDAIYKLRNAGIVNGDENGKFNPNAAATRAEAAQMIYNFIKFLN